MGLFVEGIELGGDIRCRVDDACPRRRREVVVPVLEAGVGGDDGRVWLGRGGVFGVGRRGAGGVIGKAAVVVIVVAEEDDFWDF